MNVDKRRERILRLLRHSAGVSPTELSDVLGVSRETVRNDLIQLANEGVVDRSHGSVRLADSESARESLVRSGALGRDERRREILRYIEAHTRARNSQLARRFNVTEATIRADLEFLERAGRIDRRHGGAVAREATMHAPPPLFDEGPSTSVRVIADRALSLIERGDLVFLDDSKFCVHLARTMPVDVGADVLTNSLQVALALTSRGYGSEVYMLPGRVSGQTASTSFDLRESVAARLHPTASFLGFSGFTSDRGFFTETRRQSDVADYMLGTSRHAYLMIESSAIGRSGSYGVPIRDRQDQISEIMVDDGLGAEQASRVFPRDYRVAICGDSYVLKSPFQKQYIVGFATLHMQHEFSRRVRHGMERAAERYPHLELIVADNRMNAETTIANVDRFITNRVDLVVEYQHDFHLSALIGEKLSHAGIPIIAVDIPIPGAIYFGANNYRAGRLAGRAVASEVERRWGGAVDGVYILDDAIPGPTPASRISGMIESFREIIEVADDRIHRIEVENDRQAAARQLEELFATRPAGTRVAVFGFNDEVTLGALKALEAVSLEANAVVAGHNVTPAIRRELSRHASPLLGSVSFYPEQYGQRVLDIALCMLEGRPVSPDNYTEHQWIAREAELTESET